MPTEKSVFIPSSLDTVPAEAFFREFEAKHPQFAQEAGRIKRRHDELVNKSGGLDLIDGE